MTSEEFLIKQFQQGDKKAFAKLYDSYSGALYGVILRICNDEVVAQDVLQETFVKIWRNAANYNPDKGRFYTWAYRIARNQSLNSIRTRKKLIQTEEIGVYTDITVETEAPIALNKLSGAVSNLEPHHQKAITLVYFNGLTHREAHKEMSVPLGTFKSYIQQALKKLRTEYQITILVIGYVSTYVAC